MSAGADQGVSDSLMWDQHIETKPGARTQSNYFGFWRVATAEAA